MNKRKTIFLDRDGTINVDSQFAEYIYKVEDFTFVPGALEALKMLQNAGYQLIIITNQSGIGRGYYTEEDYQNLTRYMLHEFEKNSITITGIYYCSHAPEANCECRKPKTLLIKKAAEEHDADLSKSYFIGDKTSDIAISINLHHELGKSPKTILVLTGKAGKDNRYPNAKPDHTAQNLLEAANFIIDNED